MGTMQDETHVKNPQDLVSYFERSVTGVRQYSDRFEHDYAVPAVNVSLEYFETNPFACTFLAIFSFFSFLPIFSFIGFSFFTIASFVFIAVSCTFVASAIIILILGSILLSVLTAIMFLSLFLTGFAISAYLALRLVMLVRQNGRSGMAEWTSEVKRRFINNSKAVAVDEDHSFDDSEPDSSESVVVVKEKEKDTTIPRIQSHDEGRDGVKVEA